MMASVGATVRVAVVGSGPAGIYAADALTAKNQPTAVTVDLIERLPVPFGLVRYGVAPDHVSMRGIRTTLERVLHRPNVRFLGGVEVGRDVSVESLRRSYHAIIYAHGANADRRLGIDGEDLPGSISARDFVAWYCGHPDADRHAIEERLAQVRSVVIIGMGNVALDIARVLGKQSDALAHTDMPQHVLDALARSEVRDIRILGRRGPAQASFTSKELREIGELPGTEVVLEDAALDSGAPVAPDPVSEDRVSARNVEIFTEWAERDPAPASCQIRFHFFGRPVAITGAGSVQGLTIERTELAPDLRARGTGHHGQYPADLVICAAGYRGAELAGVPFDPAHSVIAHRNGRVLRDGTVEPGEYVAGWIKRGPSGVIGTNKKDATETVAALLEDAAQLLRKPLVDPRGLTDQLQARPESIVTIEGWSAIDNAEKELGARRGRARTTIHDRADLLRVARAQSTNVVEPTVPSIDHHLEDR